MKVRVTSMVILAVLACLTCLSLVACDLVYENAASIKISINAPDSGSSKDFATGGACSKLLVGATYIKISIQKDGGDLLLAEGNIGESFGFSNLEPGIYTINVNAFVSSGATSPVYTSTIRHILAPGRNSVPICLVPATKEGVAETGIIASSDLVNGEVRGFVYKLKDRNHGLLIKISDLSWGMDFYYQDSKGEQKQVDKSGYTLVTRIDALDCRKTDGTLIITMINKTGITCGVQVSISEVEKPLVTCTVIPPSGGYITIDGWDTKITGPLTLVTSALYPLSAFDADGYQLPVTWLVNGVSVSSGSAYDFIPTGDSTITFEPLPILY
jgi:hypothetical protein